MPSSPTEADRAHDVAPFPAPCGWCWSWCWRGPRIGPHDEAPDAGDRHHGHRACDEQELAGLEVGDEHRSDDEDRSREQGAAVLVERIDQRDVNLWRQRILLLGGPV